MAALLGELASGVHKSHSMLCPTFVLFSFHRALDYTLRTRFASREIPWWKESDSRYRPWHYLQLCRGHEERKGRDHCQRPG